MYNRSMNVLTDFCIDVLPQANEAGVRLLSFGSLEWGFIIETFVWSNVVDVCG